LFLIGIAAGVDEQNVANGLMLSQIAGIAGAMTVAVCGERIPRGALLTVSVAVGVLPLFLLMHPATALTYTAAVCAFNFSANVLTPLLMALIANFDPGGRLVTRAIALQMLGLAIGPAVGARVIEAGDYTPALTLCAILLITSFVLMLPPLRSHNRAAIAA
jgi:predicted MFS family arabinose efflux permease